MRNGNYRRRRRPRANTEKLRVIPLGGLNEIGKNLTVLEYNEEKILIDCGMTFPGDEMYGIDVVIPDMTYLVQHKDQIKGLLVTHGRRHPLSAQTDKHTGIRNTPYARPYRKQTQGAWTQG